MWSTILAALVSAVAGFAGNMSRKKAKAAGKSTSAGAEIFSSVANLATTVGGAIAANQRIKEQQQFNSGEAQKARDWNLQMDNTKYQRTVADMQAAGVNPALAMDGHLSTNATSNAQAQSESGVNAITQLAALAGQMRLETRKLEQERELRSRELDIMQQNANTQAGVGQSTEEVNKANAEAVRINNEFAKRKNELTVNFMEHQVTLEQYLAECAKIDAEIKEETKDAQIATVAQNLANLETMNGLYVAQVNELNARSAKEWSEKSFVDKNAELLGSIKKSYDLENSYTQYCLDNNLPEDMPIVCLAYRQADMNYQGWTARGDKKQAQYFKNLRDNIRDMINKVGQGKMTSKEATQFWVNQGRQAITDAADITASFYLGKSRNEVTAEGHHYYKGVYQGYKY